MAVDCEDHPERVLPRIVKELQRMNVVHRDALLYLLGFCAALTNASSENKMKPCVC